MELGKRSPVTRGGILVAQLSLLAIGVTAFVERGILGTYAWVFAGAAAAGLVALQFLHAPNTEAQEAEEGLRVAEEAIKREAERLDARRAEIEKVLLAYGEWMEFPDFEQLRNVEWATPEKSERDAEVAALLHDEADRLLQTVSSGEYRDENGQFQMKPLMLDLWEFVERIAKIYNPESEKPLLETRLSDLLKAVNRASIQVILLLEEVPIVDIKEWNMRQISDNVRKAAKVAKTYKDIEPYLSPVKYLWQGSKLLLASNPIIAAGWIVGSNVAIEGGKKIGRRSMDAYLLSFVRQTLGIIAWETASIYDKTNRFRNPEWVYGVELAHLMSEFPLEPHSLRAALKELGNLALRSSYDRIFLYRCVAQHVSPKPDRFTQSDLLDDETRNAIAKQLDDFIKKHAKDAKDRKVASWRKGTRKRLGIVEEKPVKG